MRLTYIFALYFWFIALVMVMVVVEAFVRLKNVHFSAVTIALFVRIGVRIAALIRRIGSVTVLVIMAAWWSGHLSLLRLIGHVVCGRWSGHSRRSQRLNKVRHAIVTGALHGRISLVVVGGFHLARVDHAVANLSASVRRVIIAQLVVVVTAALHRRRVDEVAVVVHLHYRFALVVVIVLAVVVSGVAHVVHLTLVLADLVLHRLVVPVVLLHVAHAARLHLVVVTLADHAAVGHHLVVLHHHRIARLLLRHRCLHRLGRRLHWVRSLHRMGRLHLLDAIDAHVGHRLVRYHVH